jgi:RNA polymerase sigma factor (sigma-70 family)
LIRVYKQSGNPVLLGELYQQYMDLVYGVCLKYLEDQEAAKDAVMAIFEELALKLHRHQVDNFKAWLYTVAKNHCLMQLRSAKRLKTHALDPDRMQFTEDVHLDIVFEKEAHLNQLSDCMETLPPDQKKAVDLFYLQEKCYKEIAVETSLDWNKVRSLIQNGRRNLKICMESGAKHPV